MQSIHSMGKILNAAALAIPLMGLVGLCQPANAQIFWLPSCADGQGGYTRGIIGYSATASDCHGVSGTGATANFVVQTKGSSLGAGSDQFYYAYKTYNSGTNFTATARVMQIQNTGPAAKAGVMLRLSTLNTSKYASVAVTSNSVQFIRRAFNGVEITTVPNVTAPCWVKVEKNFDTYKGYYSINGTTWTKIGTDAYISTPGGFLAGLAATGSGGVLTSSGYTGVNF